MPTDETNNKVEPDDVDAADIVDSELSKETLEDAEAILSEMEETEDATSDRPLETDVSGWIHDHIEDTTNYEGDSVSIGSHWVTNHTNRWCAIAYDEDMKRDDFRYMDRVRFDPILDDKVVRATNVTLETRAEDFKYAEFPEHGLTEKMSPEERAAMDKQKIKSELYKKPEKFDDEDEDNKLSNPLTDDITGSMNDLL